MIKTKCIARDHLPLSAMTPFQGDLKRRKESDIDQLVASIKEEGLLMPIALWCHEETFSSGDGGTEIRTVNHILDGHGRYAALVRMALADASILTQEIPVLYIEAPNEEAARKALLQIISVYGKITHKGVAQFTSTISNYSAPVIKSTKAPSKVQSLPQSDRAIVRVSVPKEILPQFRAILESTPGVEIL